MPAGTTPEPGDWCGARFVQTAKVTKTRNEPAGAFYEDVGQNHAFVHAGRLALVGRHSGTVRLTRVLS